MGKIRFAVILSGCGVYDGAEIHEATLSLYEIMKQGAEYQIFAPNINQAHVINHLNGEAITQDRNVLIESARIARGNIKDLKDFDVSEFDSILFPGGFGVAKNFCDFAFKGAEMHVIPEIKEVILTSVENNLVIGALCISPVLFANILEGSTVTVGQDSGTIEAIEKMGGIHESTNHGEVIIDERYQLVTTPCYMLDANILDIADGAHNAIAEMINLIREKELN